uniref:Fe2OG dioxygenase domain-containing protein n=1 Tax=Brassica campestris TaxID=3711 RepID=M4F1G9_BRACM
MNVQRREEESYKQLKQVACDQHVTSNEQAGKQVVSWLHQNGAEKHSLVTEIPIGATVITIGDHGEGLQVLHYEEGQKYEPHYDYFVDDFNTKNEGQRMATMLMYLADVEEGGETVFPAANMNFSFVPWYNELSACGKKGLSIKPRMGDALLFWSMRPDATLDPSNLHGGCPVIRGNKWSSTRPTVDNKPPSKGKNRTGIIVGVIVGLGLLSILAGVGIFIIRKRRNPYTDDDELFSMKIKPFTFTYSELKSATQDFNLSNKRGEGGFEPVYKVQTQMVQFSLKCSQVVDLLIRKLSSGSYHFTRLRGNFRSTGRSVGVEAQLTHLSSITQIIDPKLHQHLDKLGGGDYLCAIQIVLLHVIV